LEPCWSGFIGIRLLPWTPAYTVSRKIPHGIIEERYDVGPLGLDTGADEDPETDDGGAREGFHYGGSEWSPGHPGHSAPPTRDPEPGPLVDGNRSHNPSLPTRKAVPASV
jgi:hypothetical protein